MGEGARKNPFPQGSKATKAKEAARGAASKKPKLLSGGNPQIGKGYGEAPISV